jgi:hypothetical protein
MIDVIDVVLTEMGAFVVFGRLHFSDAFVVTIYFGLQTLEFEFTLCHVVVAFGYILQGIDMSLHCRIRW